MQTFINLYYPTWSRGGRMKQQNERRSMDIRNEKTNRNENIQFRSPSVKCVFWETRNTYLREFYAQISAAAYTSIRQIYCRFTTSVCKTWFVVKLFCENLILRSTNLLFLLVYTTCSGRTSMNINISLETHLVKF